MEQYLQLASRLPAEPDRNTGDIPRQILPGDPEWGPQSHDREVPPSNSKWIDDLESQADVQSGTVEAIYKGLEAQTFLVGKLRTRENNNSHRCLVAARASGLKTLEHDFTTNGVQGNLRCPFAKSSDGKPENEGLPLKEGASCGRDFLDPIKAASRQGKLSSPSVSARSSVPRCPIRYLDQHSPEEVAEYFENHKHEIPRSHTVCVKRYQNDFRGARQLDAKYGSMVNMIQGLGVKHQAFLPSGDQDDANDTNPIPSKRVEQWAEDVDATPSHVTDRVQDGDNNNVEERKGHFDRPMREIRVGESPSRPWGISVPVPLEPVAEVPPSPSSPELAPVSENENRPGHTGSSRNDGDHSQPTPLPKSQGFTKDEPRGCPFSSHAMKFKQEEPIEENCLPVGQDPDADANGAERQDSTSHEDTAMPRPQATPSPSQPQPNVVFNGPVFLGYSAAEAVALIQQLGNPDVFK